jgi:hypothetical protein
LVAHSNEFSEHPGVEADGVNGKVLNKRREDVVFLGVAVENEVENLVPVGCDAGQRVVCEYRCVDFCLLLLEVLVVRA